jgi:hypothetical protein
LDLFVNKRAQKNYERQRNAEGRLYHGPAFDGVQSFDRR